MGAGKSICGVPLLLGLLAAFPARATVDDVGAAGFTVSESADIAAPADHVYRMLITPSRWWSSDHTYSHDAANLTLDARAGGCWCEALPGGGSVQHMIVVNAMPDQLLRLRGGLGPLQAMAVNGVMTFTLKPSGPNTQLAMTYAVGGYSNTGFSQFARMVDAVLGEQIQRLRESLERGSPEPASHSTNMKGDSP